MTLIIYSKCVDATIIISDKKQNEETSDPSQTVRKYFLPRHQEYVMALAGSGVRIDTITTSLDIEQTPAESVKEKIRSIVEIPGEVNLGESDGFLLIINKRPSGFYHLWTRANKFGINSDDPPFACYGDGAALGMYLLRQFDLSEVPWDVAIQYLASIMQEVAKHSDSVGNLDKFGFDYLVILDGGGVKSGIFDKHFAPQKIHVGLTPSESFTPDVVDTKPSPKKPETARMVKRSKRKAQKQSGGISAEHAVKKNKPAAKSSQLIVQTDKGVYMYDSDMLVSIIHPTPATTAPIVLKVVNSRKKTIFTKAIPVEDGADGIYQLAIPVKGKGWDGQGEEFRIVAKHGDVQGETSVWRADFGAAVELDQKAYTWTDLVRITVISPDHSIGENQLAYVGQQPDGQVTISTSRGRITNYRLVETGKGTGVFTGEIRLTGFRGHALTKNKGGITEGTNSGQSDGKVACGGEDHLVVSFTTKHDIVTGSALIRWNVGEIGWLEPNYAADSVACVRVTDPDMSLNPTEIDKFEVRAWSDSDKRGLRIPVYETEPRSGVFEGRVKLSPRRARGCLRVRDGDTINAEYRDSTLPSPHAKSDEMTMTATSVIGTHFPPLERIAVTNCHVSDEDGETLQNFEVKQKLAITATLLNRQQKSQPFVLIARIADEFGVAIQNPSVTGSLDSNEQATLSLPWVPQHSGDYSISLLAWQGIDNPDALSRTIPLKVSVSHVANRISIPLGTSTPGCEEHDRCFLPPLLRIKRSQSVVWTNDDTSAHTIISGTPGDKPGTDFDSGLFMSGDSFIHHFEDMGTYPYFCAIHPWQTGTVKVE